MPEELSQFSNEELIQILEQTQGELGKRNIGISELPPEPQLDPNMLQQPSPYPAIVPKQKDTGLIMFLESFPVELLEIGYFLLGLTNEYNNEKNKLEPKQTQKPKVNKAGATYVLTHLKNIINPNTHMSFHKTQEDINAKLFRMNEKFILHLARNWKIYELEWESYPAIISMVKVSTDLSMRRSYLGKENEHVFNTIIEQRHINSNVQQMPYTQEQKKGIMETLASKLPV